MTLNNLEWLSNTVNDTTHRAASQRQLSFLHVQSNAVFRVTEVVEFVHLYFSVVARRTLQVPAGRPGRLCTLGAVPCRAVCPWPHSPASRRRLPQQTLQLAYNAVRIAHFSIASRSHVFTQLPAAAAGRKRRDFVLPMTHIREVAAENRYQKSATCFCSVWHAILYRIFPVPVSGNK